MTNSGVAHPGVTDQTTSSERIRELVNPKSIVVIGASNTSMWSSFLYSNLTKGGFAGDVWLVNRRGEPVHEQETFTSLADVPGVPDLAVLLTASPTIEALMEECRQKGVRNVVILAGGFSEAGEEGIALQERIVRDARAAEQLILGPNNLGFTNAAAQIAAFAHMTEVPLVRGSVGLASQSGALSIYLLPYMVTRGLGTSVSVTVGNEAMLSAIDVMDYLVDDEETRVIAAYLEQIANPAQFIAVAERARAAGKPIVVFKAGRAEVAARVAAAHTGSLVGDDRVTDAVMKQLGIIRVDSIEQLVSTSGVLAEYGGLPGPRGAFVTASGAMCSVIAERADVVGIQLPEPSEETIAGIHSDGLPEEVTVNNPLDVTGAVTARPSLLTDANTRFANDENFDFVVITGSWHKDEMAERMSQGSLAATLEGIKNSPKPMIPMSFLTTELNAYARDFGARTGFPHVPDSYDRGIPALGHSVWWARRMRELAADPPHVLPSAQSRPTGAQRWTEVEAADFLRANGVPVVPSRLVQSAEAAAATAREIGLPVVLKVASADIDHKSDVGGVQLNLSTETEVRAAYDSIIASAAGLAPEAEIAGVSISPMRSWGVELLVGIVRDEEWGQVLAVALGGVLVEVLGDSALRRLPVTKPEIRRMIESLKGVELLQGFRGSEHADIDAVGDAIFAITQVALSLESEIEELEINPLLVNGNRVEAIDALVKWRPES